MGRYTFFPCPNCGIPVYKRTSKDSCVHCRACPKCGVKGRRFTNGVCKPCNKYYKKHGAYAPADGGPRKAGRSASGCVECVNCRSTHGPFRKQRCATCYNVFHATGADRPAEKTPCAKCERPARTLFNGLCSRCRPCKVCKAPGPHFIPEFCHVCRTMAEEIRSDDLDLPWTD